MLRKYMQKQSDLYIERWLEKQNRLASLFFERAHARAKRIAEIFGNDGTPSEIPQELAAPGIALERHFFKAFGLSPDTAYKASQAAHNYAQDLTEPRLRSAIFNSAKKMTARLHAYTDHSPALHYAAFALPGNRVKIIAFKTINKFWHEIFSRGTIPEIVLTDEDYMGHPSVWFVEDQSHSPASKAFASFDIAAEFENTQAVEHVVNLPVAGVGYMAYFRYTSHVIRARSITASENPAGKPALGFAEPWRS